VKSTISAIALACFLIPPSLFARCPISANSTLIVNAPAGNLSQDLYVSDLLKTGRIMVKDEDVCLHCGLCAERCPTGAWDMRKFLLNMTNAGPGCRNPR